ncbi:TA0956 family protein [Thermoplasma volcanium]|nr:TA0956 family protein [Thermoplasma volcanium]
MELCAMYNISIENLHPTTICVVMDKFLDSFAELLGVLEDQDQDELMDFISRYARTDEIRPEDKTVGFVVINSAKKMMSVSFSDIDENVKEKIREIIKPYRDSGYSVEADL